MNHSLEKTAGRKRRKCKILDDKSSRFLNIQWEGAEIDILMSPCTPQFIKKCPLLKLFGSEKCIWFKVKRFSTKKLLSMKDPLSKEVKRFQRGSVRGVLELWSASPHPAPSGK